MKKWAALITLLFLAGCSSPRWGGPELTGIEKVDLLILHNDARSTPLRMDIECDRAAQSHAEWMAEHDKMSHEQQFSYENRTVGDRLKKKWTAVGENIAVGQETPSEVVQDWLNSSGHRKNIKNSSFEHVGFGVSTSKNGLKYWCTVFSD